jgi:hypothetical protein
MCKTCTRNRPTQFTHARAGHLCYLSSTTVRSAPECRSMLGCCNSAWTGDIGARLWPAARHMVALINTPRTEVCPHVSSSSRLALCYRHVCLLLPRSVAITLRWPRRGSSSPRFFITATRRWPRRGSSSPRPQCSTRRACSTSTPRL